MIGLARYTESLCQALSEAGIAYTMAQPDYPTPVRVAHRLLSPFRFDTRTFSRERTARETVAVYHHVLGEELLAL